MPPPEEEARIQGSAGRTEVTTTEGVRWTEWLLVVWLASVLTVFALTTEIPGPPIAASLARLLQFIRSL